VCLNDLVSLVTHGANGTCGPPTLSLAAVAIFVLGVLGALGLWQRHTRSALLLCVLFALPGWWVILQRRVDDEPVLRLRNAIEDFSIAHQRCVRLDASACPECDPIARYARAPSIECAHPATVVMQAGALGGHCTLASSDQLVCGPN
jgi:hypothetical protein